jgi:hypothetical protein
MTLHTETVDVYWETKLALVNLGGSWEPGTHIISDIHAVPSLATVF